MVGFRFGGLKNKTEAQKVLKSWFSVPMVSPDMPLMLNSVDAATYSYAGNYTADRPGLNSVIGLQSNQG